MIRAYKTGKLALKWVLGGPSADFYFSQADRMFEIKNRFRPRSP